MAPRKDEDFTQGIAMSTDINAIEKQRFEQKTKQADSGCIEWIGSVKPDGYGNAWHNGSNIPAHRLSWILHHGQIPHGMFVCHKCDNPRCVNVDHLFVGTHTDNMRDMFAKGRSRWQKSSPSGRKPYAKKSIDHASRYGSSLDESSVAEIKRLIAKKTMIKEVASMFGVSRPCISAIKAGRRWAHVPAIT